MFFFSRGRLKRHSRRVQTIKRILPVFAFLVGAVILVMPAFREQKESVILSMRPKELLGTEVTMENIRFLWMDDKEQPLKVTTDTVHEVNAEKQIYKLTGPKLTYVMNGGNVLTGETVSALADRKQEEVIFDQPMTLVTEDGWKADVKNVMCRYRTGTAASSYPVVISGPSGTLKADGFIIYDKGKQIDFKKNVKTTIHTEKVPVFITSEEGALVDQKNRTVTFNKNVKSIQGDKTLIADVMVVWFRKNAKTNKFEVVKVDVTGHVMAFSGNQKIKGEQGVYIPETGLVKMEKNVQLIHGGSVVNIEQATLNLITGKATFKGQKTKDAPTGRIKGKLMPADFKEKR